MRNQIDGAVSILAAFLVLFTAMLDPVWAAGLAVLALLVLGMYEFARGRRQQHKK